MAEWEWIGDALWHNIQGCGTTHVVLSELETSQLVSVWFCCPNDGFVSYIKHDSITQAWKDGMLTLIKEANHGVDQSRQ